MSEHPTKYELEVKNVENNRIEAPKKLQVINDEPSNAEGKGMGTIFFILFVFFTIVNLGFIISSLVYAYQDSACVLAVPDGFSFNLKTWLQVDAYLRIALITLLLVVAIVSCINFKAGVGLAFCVICTMLIYSLFSFAWTIVGSVLYWGKLNPTGICTGGVHDYMYALLIITYITICLNCIVSGKQGKSQN